MKEKEKTGTKFNEAKKIYRKSFLQTIKNNEGTHYLYADEAPEDKKSKKLTTETLGDAILDMYYYSSEECNIKSDLNIAIICKDENIQEFCNKILKMYGFLD